MKTKFNTTSFISKRRAESIDDLIFANNQILISITTNPVPNTASWNCKQANLQESAWKDILRLEFDDADPLHMNGEEIKNYNLFNENHAISILKFLKKYQESAEDVIVHCEAGISRSAAVSKFIAYIYNLRFPEHYAIYNKHIFSTLLKIYGESLYGDGLISINELPGELS